MENNLEQNKPRFKQTYSYNLINRLLMLKGVFRGVNFADLNSILDIGCGEASDISFIVRNDKNKQRVIVGLNITSNQGWKNVISCYGNVDFTVASAHYLPFRPETFDFVFLKDVLHHIVGDHRRVIEEASNVVSRGDP